MLGTDSLLHLHHESALVAVVDFSSHLLPLICSKDGSGNSVRRMLYMIICTVRSGAVGHLFWAACPLIGVSLRGRCHLRHVEWSLLPCHIVSNLYIT